MRPGQWSKNLVVVAALVFSRAFRDPAAVLTALAALGVFTLASGSAYLLNDASDAEHDRRHPLKRNRPIAAGLLSAPVALGVGGAGAVIAIALGSLLAWPFGVAVAGYLALQLAYSWRLKDVVLVDVTAIAVGFVLRAVGGALVIGVAISPWLYLCTFLLALFLAFNKRWGEIAALGPAGDARPVLHLYTREFLWTATVITTASVLMSYAMYTFLAPNLPSNHAMMFTIPLVMYGLLRYLYLVHVHQRGETPERLLYQDPGILISVGAWAVLTLALVQFAS